MVRHSGYWTGYNGGGQIRRWHSMESMAETMEPEEKILLYSIGALDNSPMRSKVKLQKLLFLISKVFPEWDELLEFESHLLGPYSERVDNSLEDLTSLGLLIKTGSSYSLTKDGKMVFSTLQPNARLVEVIEDYKDFLNDLTDDQVLTFVYVFYPEYIGESAKWDDLKSKRVKNAIAMMLRGKITFSKAAEVAGLSPEEFSTLLKRRGVNWRMV